MGRGCQMGKTKIVSIEVLSQKNITLQMRGVYISSCLFQQTVYLWNRNDADKNTAVQSQKAVSANFTS